MKRPHHMTMKELTTLPVVNELASIASAPVYLSASDIYGGAFEDDRGLAWGTLLGSEGWVRYPLRRPQPQPIIGASVIKSLLSPRRALARLPA